MSNFKVSDKSQNIGKLGSIVTELSNLDFKMAVLIFNKSSNFLYVSPSLLPKLMQSSVYVVDDLGSSLITSLLTFSNIAGRCPFFQQKLLSFHPLFDFVAVSTQFFVCFVLSKKTFQLIFMWLCECMYICMQVCIYIVMFVVPTSFNPLQSTTEIFQ